MARLELAVIIPTRDERENVEPLLAKLEDILSEIVWEAIFVDDDSEDGTADLVRDISLRDPRVRPIQRIGRRGLASAVIEGMLATAAPFIAVIDADLQHDETVLPAMLQRLKQGNLDVVVASRNLDSGGMGEFHRRRVLLSNLGMKLSQAVCHTQLSDPMSGFFLLRRSYFEEVNHNLSGIGFKILVDLLASSARPVRIAEIPYTFRSRQRGQSKLDSAVAMEYLLLLADKFLGRWIPVRFALFALVGLFGVLVHLAVLGTLHFKTSLPFTTAQIVATVAAMISNFWLNNLVTYRDRRLRGWSAFRGLLSFCLGCSVGAGINLGLARLLIGANASWYAAGLAGTVVSSVWNFGITGVYTWRGQRKKSRSREQALPAAIAVASGD